MNNKLNGRLVLKQLQYNAQQEKYFWNFFLLYLNYD
jgi:hypothetical protein